MPLSRKKVTFSRLLNVFSYTTVYPKATKRCPAQGWYNRLYTSLNRSAVIATAAELLTITKKEKKL